jgi:hypothetical protein
MDVTLPDGQVIKDVPDGTTKTQLAAKLNANGFKVPTEWLGTIPAPAPSGLQHLGDAASLIASHPFTTGAGMLENAVSGIGGTVGKLGGRLADLVTGTPNNRSDSWQQALQYQPRTAAGQQIQQLTGQEGQAIGSAVDKIPGVNTPLGQTLKSAVPEALTDVGLVAGAKPLFNMASRGGPYVAPPVAPTAQSVLDSAAAAQPQNMGAAAAAARISQSTPELQQAVLSANRKGGSINPEVIGRHIEADSLPVPVKLTEGQATQSPALISQEMNLRGKYPALADKFNSQNGALVGNLQALRDQVGPDVFSANTVEHGDSLIAAYKAKDDAAQAGINANYQALRDANGGQFPIDPIAVLDDAKSSLHKNLLFDHAPKAIMNTLGRLADNGTMSLENYEALRTNLARIQRSFATDGNEKAAAGVIRNALENVPLSAGAAKLKGLADVARNSARQQFQALDADPAYKAAVNDTVPPDRFVNRFVIKAPRDDLAIMQQNLGDIPTAKQTIAVAAIDHLRNAARIAADGNGTFSQAGYNKALQGLSPKIRSLVDPKTSEQLDTLGNVSRYTMAQPRGSFVNNSNTLVGALQNHTAGAIEGAVNFAAHGVPVGTIGRKGLGMLSTGRYIKRVTAPGAGLLTPYTAPATGPATVGLLGQ